MYFKKPDRLAAIYGRASFAVYTNKADWAVIGLKLLWGPLWMWRHTAYRLKYTLGFVLFLGVAPLVGGLAALASSPVEGFLDSVAVVSLFLGMLLVVRNSVAKTSSEMGLAARRSNVVYLNWLLDQGVPANTRAGTEALTQALRGTSAEIIHSLLSRGAVLSTADDDTLGFAWGSEIYLRVNPEELEAMRQGGKREGACLAFRDVWIHLLSSQKGCALFGHIDEGKPLLSTYVDLLGQFISSRDTGPSPGGTNNSGLPPVSDGPTGSMSAEEGRLSKLAHENPEMDFQEFVKKAGLGTGGSQTIP